MKNIILCCLFLITLCAPLRSEEKFVYGVVKHQLGNQMFQVAAVCSLAWDNGATPIFPLLKDPKYDSYFNHVFWRVNTTPQWAPIESTYVEYGLPYVKIPYSPNMSVEGFFQSEKFFIQHKERILELFAPNEQILTFLESKYPEILAHPKSVAVHIRTYLPDYPKGNNFFAFLGWDYFKKMMGKFPKDSLFVICSDRIDLCKKQLGKMKRNLIFIEGNAHYQDLYLMSRCKHNIISNSSFSWWSAYLNPNPQKLVVAPPYWFKSNHPKYNCDDVIPKEWVIYK